VISSRRILAAGWPHGFVIYDLPDIPVPHTEFAIPIQPIWRYEGDGEIKEESYFQPSSPLFYERPRSSTPLVYILETSSILHFFKFSDSNIVEGHRLYDLGSNAFESTTKIGFLRGIMINDGPTRMEDDDEEEEEQILADIFLLPPSDEVGKPLGAPWLIPFGEHDNIYTRDVSIDDRSGRVAILIHDHTKDVRHILFIDPVAMPWEEDTPSPS
jgi:hypothetical protein